MEISKFNSLLEKKPSQDITIEQYISHISIGANKEDVIKARQYKVNGDKELYDKIKTKQPCVTGSATMNGTDKTANSIKKLNGYIVIDIDSKVNTHTLNLLKSDKYTCIIHRSFGGDGVCIFVKINPEKFLESFNGLALHYLNDYNLVIDQSCKNKNRLRFLSYDPEIFHNEKSDIFKDYPKKAKDKAPHVIFVKSDFDAIITRIVSSSHDLTDDSYQRFLTIGFALASEFGESGINYFHNIVQFSSKYNRDVAEKQYLTCCKSTGSGVTIASIYYFAKEKNIEIYSAKTKDIISVASQTKRRKSNPEDAENNLKQLYDIEINEEVKDIIDKVFKSNEVLDKAINEDETEIGLIEKFVFDMYKPRHNVVKNIDVINDETLVTDREESTIYIDVKKSMNFNVKKSDVLDVLSSTNIPEFNPILDFIEKNKGVETNNELTKLCESIESDTGLIDDNFEPDFVSDMVKKWFVSMFSFTDDKYSPLMLVFSGSQGNGKSYFFEHLLPKELKDYVTTSQLDQGKDDYELMHSNILLINDEFGGQTVKDSKRFKDLISKNYVKYRPPYGRREKSFKRIALFCGTTNENDILSDATGNRRIIPINVISINQDAYNKIDKTKLFIDAYNHYKNGFDYSILKGDILRLNNNSKDFEKDILEEQLVLEKCVLIDNHKYGLTTTEVMLRLQENRGLKQSLILKRVSNGLKKLGATMKNIKRDGRVIKMYNVETLENTYMQNVINTQYSD